ncbi:MAG TPA: alkaline phosphatase [Pontiella sp.]|nr:alkaline phosphatase [Pontiella sp.]
MVPIIKRLTIFFALALLLSGTAALAGASRQPVAENPKYVFFFLGDGMSTAQIEAAAAFKAGDENRAESLLDPASRLHMTQLPATGLAETFAANRFITDSAAAATAFTCGCKTRPGTLGRNTALDKAYKSIAELAQERGRAIGLISSAPLSHATPAGYYANVNSRYSYCEIGYQAARSGFEFFGGAHFSKLNSDRNAGKVVLKQAFTDAGYAFLTDKEEILQLADKEKGKVICSVATPHDGSSMPYAIDRSADNFTLADITQVAINYLGNDPEGFFILVEGGKIDWACHVNDAATALVELIAFDDAVGVARDFLAEHPSETLIIVTGDHETGGLGIGYSGTRYQTRLQLLNKQKKSAERFVTEDLAAYRQTHPWTGADCNIDSNMKQLIESTFGLDWNGLSEYQREQLETAYDASFGLVKEDGRPSGYDLDGETDVHFLTYGEADPLTVTLTRMLNNEAGLQWTTFSHTAAPVPVMAAGA